MSEGFQMELQEFKSHGAGCTAEVEISSCKCSIKYGRVLHTLEAVVVFADVGLLALGILGGLGSNSDGRCACGDIHDAFNGGKGEGYRNGLTDSDNERGRRAAKHQLYWRFIFVCCILTSKQNIYLAYKIYQ